jgi:hypothetical protein
MCFVGQAKAAVEVLPLPLQRFEKLSNQASLFVITICSLVVFLAALFSCGNTCNGNTVWAICCGVICFVVAGFFAMQFKRGQGANIDPGHLKVLATFLFLMWTFGAFILTFSGPFTNGGNGDLASWIAFLASLTFFLRVVFDKTTAALGVENKADKFALAAQQRLLISAREVLGIIFSASIIELASSDTGAKNGVYAICVGAISATFCGVALLLDFFKSPMSSENTKKLAWFLFLWWSAGAFVLTFSGPFTDTNNGLGVGNGYFSSWLAFASSGYYWVLLVGEGNLFGVNVASDEAVAKANEAGMDPTKTKPEEPKAEGDGSVNIFVAKKEQPKPTDAPTGPAFADD